MCHKRKPTVKPGNIHLRHRWAGTVRLCRELPCLVDASRPSRRYPPGQLSPKTPPVGCGTTFHKHLVERMNRRMTRRPLQSKIVEKNCCKGFHMGIQPPRLCVKTHPIN